MPEPEGEATEWVEGLEQQVDSLHAQLSAPGVDAEKLLGEMSALNEIARGDAQDKKLLLVGVVLVVFSFMVLAILGGSLFWFL
ncbi:MAG: hypothetical protein GY822_03880 [Deltaproteobacteria bacterium]|nr:hypothetical protein [Deltaproteobacteria bacterium]